MNFPEHFCYSQSSYKVNDTSYYYEFHYMCKYYLIWILPIIIIIGILGSFFCILFLLCSKLFPKNLLLWLISICVGDLMILLLDGVWMLLKMWFGYDIRDINDFFCVSHKFLSNYFFYWSAYMQTMVSIQRAYLIMKPIQARMSLVIKRLIIIWLLLSLLLILPHIIYILKFRVRNGDCDPDPHSVFYVTSLSDLIIWGCVPFILMVISTIIISVNVFSFQNRAIIKKSTTNTSTRINSPRLVYNFVNNNPSTYLGRATTSQYSSNLYPPSLSRTTKSFSLNPESTAHKDMAHFMNDNSNNNSNSTIGTTTTTTTTAGRRHGGENTTRHVTQLLIGMNLCYLLSTFPFLLFLFHINFIDPSINGWRRKLFYYLFRSFTLYNTCTNWIFYCAAGHLFRSTAKKIIQKLFCSKCVHINYSSNSLHSIHNPQTINHHNHRIFHSIYKDKE